MCQIHKGLIFIPTFPLLFLSSMFRFMTFSTAYSNSYSSLNCGHPFGKGYQILLEKFPYFVRIPFTLFQGLP